MGKYKPYQAIHLKKNIFIKLNNSNLHTVRKFKVFW